MVRRNSFELDPTSHPLAPAIIAFNRGNGWYRAVLGEPSGGDWVRLSEFSSDEADLERRLSSLELTYGGHAGYAAASLIQQAAHPLVSLTAWCILLGPGIPDISPKSVWLRQHPQGLFDRVAISGEFTIPVDGEESAVITGAAIAEHVRATHRIDPPCKEGGGSRFVARCERSGGTHVPGNGFGARVPNHRHGRSRSNPHEGS